MHLGGKIRLEILNRNSVISAHLHKKTLKSMKNIFPVTKFTLL